MLKINELDFRNNDEYSIDKKILQKVLIKYNKANMHYVKVMI